MTRRRRLTSLLGAIAMVAGGTFSAVSASAAGPSGLTWSAPDYIDNSQGSPTAISCASADFCRIGDEGGSAITGGGQTWSTPTSVFGPNPVKSISCPSTSFCMAVTGGFGYARFDGTSWSDPQFESVPSTYYPLSCVSATFCAAFAWESAMVWDGAYWNTVPAPADQTVDAVSCVSATFCWGADRSGNVLKFNGKRWLDPVHVSDNGLQDLSCVSRTFCAALDVTDQVLFWNGTSWSAPVRPGAGVQLYALSCASASYCAGLGTDYRTYIYDGSTWSDVAESTGPALRTIDCPAHGFCEAVTRAGTAQELIHDEWQPRVRVDTPPQGNLTDVSCVGTRFCAATSEFGALLTFNGDHWRRTKIAKRRLAAGAVSCASAQSCIALGGEKWWRYDGTAWSRTRLLDHDGTADAISCPSVSFCLATGSRPDDSSVYWTYDGSRWSPAALTGPANQVLVSLSCTDPNYCVALDVGGHYTVFRDGTWSAPALPDGQQGLSVSCSSRTFCLFGTAGINRTIEYDGTNWSWVPIDANSAIIKDVSCRSATFCAAVDSNGMAYTFDGTAWSSPERVEPYPQVLPSTISCGTRTLCVITAAAGDVVYGTA